MIADEYATRRPWMRRPPANAEGVLVEVGEDLVAKVAPDGHIDPKRSAKSSVSRLSRRVVPGEAFSIGGCHKPPCSSRA